MEVSEVGCVMSYTGTVYPLDFVAQNVLNRACSKFSRNAVGTRLYTSKDQKSKNDHKKFDHVRAMQGTAHIQHGRTTCFRYV